jgi:hypothetical protein
VLAQGSRDIGFQQKRLDAALRDAQWAMLTGPIAAALPDGLLPAELLG